MGKLGEQERDELVKEMNR